MALDFEELIRLWADPVPEGQAGVEKFGRFYTDPVTINGSEVALSWLAERARATQKTFADLKGTLVRRVDGEGHTAIVFRMGGRHVGPLATPLGEIAPTGKFVERQIIDVLILKDGLVTEVWMVSDELGALVQMGAVALAPAGPR